MAATEKEDFPRALGGGAVGGLVGGLVLLAFFLAMAASQGADLWPVLKGAAAPFYGTKVTGAAGFDAGPVIVGSIAHFAIAIGWGVLFGWAFYGLTRGATIIAALGWGVVVWLGMYYVVLPMVGLGAITRGTPITLGIGVHLLYGLGLGLAFLPFQRRKVAPMGRAPIVHAR
jgi:hypothetical protein